MFKFKGGQNKEEKQGKRIELDVREQLRKKEEPFQLIMETVKTVQKEDVFVLHATFKPTPLLGLMKVKGFTNEVEQLEKDHWVVTFRHKSNKEAGAADSETPSGAEDAAQSPAAGAGAGHAAAPAAGDGPQSVGGATAAIGTLYELDNRGLEPPSPMIRTLKKLEQVMPGDTVRIHNDRVPMFLIEELNGLGYPFEVEEQPDGSAKVSIHKR